MSTFRSQLNVNFAYIFMQESVKLNRSAEILLVLILERISGANNAQEWRKRVADKRRLY